MYCNRDFSSVENDSNTTSCPLHLGCSSLVPPSIPKGLRHKAQGCDEGATLGKIGAFLDSTPTGLRRVNSCNSCETPDQTELLTRIPRIFTNYPNSNDPISVPKSTTTRQPHNYKAAASPSGSLRANSYNSCKAPFAFFAFSAVKKPAFTRIPLIFTNPGAGTTNGINRGFHGFHGLGIGGRGMARQPLYFVLSVTSVKSVVKNPLQLCNSAPIRANSCKAPSAFLAAKIRVTRISSQHSTLITNN